MNGMEILDRDDLPLYLVTSELRKSHLCDGQQGGDSMKNNNKNKIILS